MTESTQKKKPLTYAEANLAFAPMWNFMPPYPSTKMNPIALLKITFALSVAFTFASTLYALNSK
jgi:hypothetical protein